MMNWRLMTLSLALMLLHIRALAAQDKKPLEIAFYSSVLHHVNEKYALESTKPWLDYMGRSIQRPLNARIVHGSTTKQLLEFGKYIGTEKTLDGRPIHLGIVWGIEYGWLKRQDKNLEPFVMSFQGGIEWPLQIMVRDETKADFADLESLRGRTLAVSKNASLLNQAYLISETRKLSKKAERSKPFFGKVLLCANLSDAIAVIRSGTADCLAVDAQSYTVNVYGKRNIRLHKLHTSEPFPIAAVIGNRKTIEGLSSGLWEQCQKAVERTQTTPEGKQCTKFWGADRFVLPGSKDSSKFPALVEKSVEKYPLETLSGARFEDLGEKVEVYR